MATVPLSGSAGDQHLSLRARDALRRILAQNISWEQTHAADALIACGDGEVVHRRYLSEAENGTPPFRTVIWRMMALTASDGPERRIWDSKLEEVLREPEASDRFTAAEVLGKLHHRLSGEALARSRQMAADPNRAHALFGWWGLAVREEPGALQTIAASLRSDDPSARGLAASILRWLRPGDPQVLGELARAADTELAGSPAFTSVVGAAVMLNADPAHRQAWRAKLEEVVRQGPARPRWAACQALMLGYTQADLPKVIPFLDAPDPDSRIGAAWTILHAMGGSRLPPG